MNNNPSTVLGCWVINHDFNGSRINNDIVINGNFDVNIWYSYDNDTKTDVVKENISYKEIIHMRERDESSEEEIIVRSLKQPNCLKMDINGDSIKYSIEKELGIELVDNIKVKIDVSEDEEPWDDIVDETNSIDDVKEEFLND